MIEISKVKKGSFVTWPGINPEVKYVIVGDRLDKDLIMCDFYYRDGSTKSSLVLTHHIVRTIHNYGEEMPLRVAPHSEKLYLKYLKAVEVPIEFVTKHKIQNNYLYTEVDAVLVNGKRIKSLKLDKDTIVSLSMPKEHPYFDEKCEKPLKFSFLPFGLSKFYSSLGNYGEMFKRKTEHCLIHDNLIIEINEGKPMKLYIFNDPDFKIPPKVNGKHMSMEKMWGSFVFNKAKMPADTAVFYFTPDGTKYHAMNESGYKDILSRMGGVDILEIIHMHQCSEPQFQEVIKTVKGMSYDQIVRLNNFMKSYSYGFHKKML